MEINEQIVFTRAAVRSVDQDAINEYLIPGIVLMENAARNLALLALELLEEIDSNSVLICCGPGNNGGDGFALARHLHNEGTDVHLLLTHPVDRYQGDAAVNLAIVQKMNLPITIINRENPDSTLRGLPDTGLLVDALLGTGLDRPVKSPIAEVINWLNKTRASAGQDFTTTMRLLAVDIPTGLDCDTGISLGETVRADATVTFVGLKKGFLNVDAQQYLGEIYIGDIGAPVELYEKYGKKTPIPSRDYVLSRVSEVETSPGPQARPGED